jgi:YD repeat-containing protein
VKSFYKAKFFGLISVSCMLFSYASFASTAPAHNRSTYSKSKTVKVSTTKNVKHSAPAKKSYSSADISSSNQPPQINAIFKSAYGQGSVSSYSLSVNPFTGRVQFSIPLINIPLNDGLHLQVTYASNPGVNFTQGDFGTYIPQVFIPSNDFYNGDQSGNGDYVTPKVIIFYTPSGKKIKFSSKSNSEYFPGGILSPLSANYFSASNWKATATYRIKDNIITDTDGGFDYEYISLSGHFIITSPNGTKYYASGSKNSGDNNYSLIDLKKIISPHGASTINYIYNRSVLTSIKASNGFYIDFSGSTMTDSSGRKWELSSSYSRQGWVDSCTLTLPNNKNWHFGAGLYFDYKPRLSNGNISRNWIYIFRINSIITPNNLHLSLGFNQNAPQHNWHESPNERYYIPVSSANYSGPGIPTTTWNYSYSGSTDNPTSTTVSNTVISKTYTFVNGNYNAWNTGLLTNETIYSTKTGAAIPVKSIANTWSARLINSNGGNIQVPELDKQVITEGQAYTTTYSNYDNYGYPTDISYSSPQGTITKKLTYYENPTLWIFGPLTSISYNGTKSINSVINTYNSQGQLLSTSQNGVKTSYTYNSLGDIASETNPLGGIWKFANYMYGLPESVTDPLGNITIYKINPNGTVASQTTASGNTTSYTYDSMLRLTSITPATGNKTTISWDTNNQNSKTITKGSLVTTTTYNALGKPINLTETDGNNTSTINYKYDQLGNNIFTSYPNSSYGIQKTFDALGRVTSITSDTPFISNNVTLNYSAPNSTLSWSTNGLSKIVSFSIYQNDVLLATIPSNLHSYVIYLTKGNTYNFSVSANAKAGNKLATGMLEITDTVQYVSAPLNVSMWQTNSNKTDNLSWTKPALGKVSYYTVMCEFTSGIVKGLSLGYPGKNGHPKQFATTQSLANSNWVFCIPISNKNQPLFNVTYNIYLVAHGANGGTATSKEISGLHPIST